MAIETTLIRGIAALIAESGAGVWSTTTAYAASQVGIYDGTIPEDTIEGIGLAAYPVDDPVHSTSTIGVQVTFRSTSKAALRDRAETVFDALHAMWGRDLGTLRLEHLLRRSSADLGIDEQGAFRRTDNYYAIVNHPTANRP